MELNRYKKRNGYGQYRYKHVVMVRPSDNIVVVVPPKVPPKDDDDDDDGDDDSVTDRNLIGYWNFGLRSAAAAGESDDEDDGSTSTSGRRNSGDDEEEGSARWVSNKNRRYGVVGAVGGTREEPFRPKSQYGVLDSVSVDGVSRPTSHFVPVLVPGNEGEDVEGKGEAKGTVEVV